MPAKNRIPTYRHHKASGQAFIELNGRRFYCGTHGSADSWQRYHEIINQWLANDRQLEPSAAERRDMTVSELLNEFRRFAADYYGDSGEIEAYAVVSRIVRSLYGSTPVRDVTPRHLKTIMQAMASKGWVRTSVNRNATRVRRIFKWGTAEGLVPVGIYHGLQAVDGIRRGRANVKEGEKVRPVPEHDIEAVRGRVSRQIRALIDLQLLTGARAGELVLMRPIDIETTGNIWTYTPQHHKSEHHDYERVIYLGPRAQEVVKPFLSRPVESFMFSPAEVEAERREMAHTRRKTPLHYGNKPGTNRRRDPKRRPHERYTTSSYRRAIHRACDDAGVARWSPHRLRHNAATNLRREHGIEAARIILGHRSANTTEIYTELDRAKAIDVIGKVG